MPCKCGAKRWAMQSFPDYFVNAQTLAPLEHVRMQAAAQKWIDSSISKTINCPEDISFEAFKDVYMAAWDQGCKGCTTYRPNAVTGSVLSVSEEGEKTPEADTGADVVYISEPLSRPEALEGHNLQGEMARQRACTLHHRERSCCSTGTAGRLKSSSIPRTWSISPGPWRSRG